MNDSVYIRAYKNFINHIKNENVEINDAIDLLRSLIFIIEDFGHFSGFEKKELVIKLLEDIAAGNDGILNTDDDVIPSYILKSLKLLIESDLVSSTIDLICEVTHTKKCCSLICYLRQLFCCFSCCFSCCLPRCLPCCFSCCIKEKKNKDIKTPLLNNLEF